MTIPSYSISIRILKHKVVEYIHVRVNTERSQQNPSMKCSPEII